MPNLFPENAYILLDGETEKRYADENGSVIIRSDGLLTGIVGGINSTVVRFSFDPSFIDTENDVLVEIPIRTFILHQDYGELSNAYIKISGETENRYTTGGTVSVANGMDIYITVSADNCKNINEELPTITAHTQYNYTLNFQFLRIFNISYIGGGIPSNAYVLLDGETEKHYANESGVVTIRNSNPISGIISGDYSTIKTFMYGSVTADTSYNVALEMTYEITSVSDLVTLRNGVNSGTTFNYNGNTIPALALGINFSLTADLDLSSVCGSGIGDWIPIGIASDKEFKGNFNGNNHTISNLYAKGSKSYIALFGRIYKSNISNIILDNVDIYASDYAAGVVCIANATSTDNNYYINNCHIKNSKIADRSFGDIGGIVWNATWYNISNCTTDSNTILGDLNNRNLSRISGIICESQYTPVTYCINNATIYGYQYLGGITYKGRNNKYCINNGTIYGIQRIGGISSYINGTNLDYCVNNGNIISNSMTDISTEVGGIYSTYNYGGSFKYLLNTASISVNSGSTSVGSIGGTLGDTYLYDKDYYSNQFNKYGAFNNADAVGYGEGKSVLNLIGFELKTGTTGVGWTDEKWTFEAGRYPIPKGLETYDAAIAGAQPVIIASGETYTGVSTNFTVGIGNGCTWTATNGMVTIDNQTGNVTINSSGDEILTVYKNSIPYKKVFITTIKI